MVQNFSKKNKELWKTFIFKTVKICAGIWQCVVCTEPCEELRICFGFKVLCTWESPMQRRTIMLL